MRVPHETHLWLLLLRDFEARSAYEALLVGLCEGAIVCAFQRACVRLRQQPVVPSGGRRLCRHSSRRFLASVRFGELCFRLFLVFHFSPRRTVVRIVIYLPTLLCLLATGNCQVSPGSPANNCNHSSASLCEMIPEFRCAVYLFPSPLGLGFTPGHVWIGLAAIAMRQIFLICGKSFQGNACKTNNNSQEARNLPHQFRCRRLPLTLANHRTANTSQRESSSCEPTQCGARRYITSSH